MYHPKPTHHQMVRSLYAEHPNMEELARKTGIPVGRLWDAYNNPDAQLTHHGSKLEDYYYGKRPEGHFSQFFERLDEELQSAFYKAVTKDPEKPEQESGAKSDLRDLFEKNWPGLSTWYFKDQVVGQLEADALAKFLRTEADTPQGGTIEPPLNDPPAVAYINTRYLTVSGWTDIPLEPKLRQCDALRRAISTAGRGLSQLDLDPERRHYDELRMKFVRLQLSARQKLSLVEHKEQLPVAKALPSLELQNLLDFLLLKVTTIWPEGYIFRWSWARDAISISSGLAELAEGTARESLHEKCATAYAILRMERPEFSDIDHPEWSVGPAADDPDLKFFRENIDSVRKMTADIIRKICAEKESVMKNRKRTRVSLAVKKEGAGAKKTRKPARVSLAVIGILLATSAVGYGIVRDLTSARVGTSSASIVWPNKLAVIVWPDKVASIRSLGETTPT
jgi:hypothetical protein